jgi:hypothetical protein
MLYFSTKTDFSVLQFDFPIREGFVDILRLQCYIEGMQNPFSKDQLSIVTGSLLGDGHITKPRYGDSAFTKGQCSDHRDYLDWHLLQFQGLCCPIRSYKTELNCRVYLKDLFRVKSHPIFTEMRHTWYPKDEKIVPPDIALDPLALSIWYFDDGGNNPLARLSSFATYCFSLSDVEFLKSLMDKQFNIKCRIDNRKVLHVRSESYKDFIDIVRPFMLWPCFQHKVLYRESSAHHAKKSDIDTIVKLHRNGKPAKVIASLTGFSLGFVYSTIKEKRRLLDESRSLLSLNNTSGIKGVSWDNERKKWIASYETNGKHIKVGRFDSISEASRAISEARHSNTCR